jgi:hypothetical protein
MEEIVAEARPQAAVSSLGSRYQVKAIRLPLIIGFLPFVPASKPDILFLVSRGQACTR